MSNKRVKKNRKAKQQFYFSANKIDIKTKLNIVKIREN